MSDKPTVCRALAFLFVAALVAVPRMVVAQACDDNTRAEFAQAVTDGASDSELEARFGPCRSAFTEPTCKPTQVVTTGSSRFSPSSSKILTITNYNTSYERMNGCGYHPQSKMIACDVEIRRPTGYGAFPGGTFENVRFCLDCDGIAGFEFTTVGFVHVTDNVSPQPTPSWYHMAFASTFGATTCNPNNGRQGNARAILSWFAMPANCNSVPFWGNRFDFTIRRDP